VTDTEPGGKWRQARLQRADIQCKVLWHSVQGIMNWHSVQGIINCLPKLSSPETWSWRSLVPVAVVQYQDCLAIGRIGQNQVNTTYTVILALKSPSIRSFPVFIYSSGQTQLFGTNTTYSVPTLTSSPKLWATSNASPMPVLPHPHTYTQFAGQLGYLWHGPEAC